MDFGDAFLAASRAPLVDACARFKMNLVGDGVRLLAPTELRAALAAGVAATARAARAKPAVVERSGETEKLAALARRIEADHAVALGAVRRDDHTITVFAMPQAATSPTEHLAALAEHFARDKEIAAALRQLTTDLTEWERLLAATAVRLDQDGELRASLQRSKRIRGALVVGTIGVASAIAIATAVAALHAAAEKRAREASAAEEHAAQVAAAGRIGETLAAADPCAPPDVADGDRVRATEEQKVALEARKARCVSSRAALEHAAWCQSLAERVDRHEAIAEDGKLGSSAALLSRIAASALHAPDLLTEDAAIPCADTPAGAKLWRAFAHASGDAILLWTKVEAISPRVAKVLVAEKAVSEASKRALTFQIERVATDALRKPTPENLARARVLCSFKAELGLVIAMSCRKAQEGS